MLRWFAPGAFRRPAMKSATSVVGRESCGRQAVAALATLAICFALPLAAQAPAGQSPASSSLPAGSNSAENAAPEVTSHDQATTFKVNVRLVLVRVVVRDPEGRAIGSLGKEDFQLFDDRKPQVISQFSVEQPGTQVAREQKRTALESGETPSNTTPNVPERFIAYLFDDIHITTEDVLAVRQAASRHLSSLQATDRAAIFTTSGQGDLDFTDDHGKLSAALLRIQPRPIARAESQQCPYMSYYMADLIVNKNFSQVLESATKDALQCSGMASSASSPALAVQALNSARNLAESAAQTALNRGENETHVVLGSVKDVVRRMSSMPGQRTIVLVSPGFLTLDLEPEVSELIDHALRANIVVSAVDARGLYVPAGMGDISRANVPNLGAAPQEALYENEAASLNSDVLSNLAASTGGIFFHNSNDLEGGLRQAAEAPAYYYVLAFSPQNLKYDGRFHRLTVKLSHPAKLTVEARQGYYAPQHAPDAGQEAHQEIEEAVFSQEEMHDLPVDLHTQFFKSTDVDAKLSVLVHVDVKRMHFRKAEGRNNNNLTIVAALFDRNGSFITGNEKILEMRLKDETLERRLPSGFTMKTSFDVKPGSYLVRLVVRDTEGLLSAENGAIEIP
ncbi:MAG TPA: VWA domain-containing protein [Terriglobales bacterium]|nr:VWA domain-containing protein [Terriglobales bacterium]